MRERVRKGELEVHGAIFDETGAVRLGVFGRRKRAADLSKQLTVGVRWGVRVGRCGEGWEGLGRVGRERRLEGKFPGKGGVVMLAT